jgi:hypothetical protein
MSEKMAVEFETRKPNNIEWITDKFEFSTSKKAWDFANALRFANNVKNIRLKEIESISATIL